MVIVILALVTFGIIARKVRLGLWEVLPFIVEESLQFNACEIDGCTSGVELEIVTNRELEISKKCLSGGIFMIVQLLPHC